MKGIMITSEGCDPCKQLKDQFADLVASGEIVEINFEKEPEKAMELMQKHGADIPSLLILADNGDLIMSL